MMTGLILYFHMVLHYTVDLGLIDVCQTILSLLEFKRFKTLGHLFNFLICGF